MEKQYNRVKNFINMVYKIYSSLIVDDNIVIELVKK